MLITKVKEVISEILKCNQYASRIIKINTKYLRFVSMPVSTDQQWFISIRIPPSGQRAFARWYHNWNIPGNSKIKLIQLNLLINKKSRKRIRLLSSIWYIVQWSLLEHKQPLSKYRPKRRTKSFTVADGLRDY